MLSNLNDKQREAVIAVNGPVMVFAGAGSGKTRTLTYRVAYMIGEKKINPFHILAITFTNKATNEMRARLESLVGPGSKDVTISTIHSLCARILRREIRYLGYTSNFSIVDEEDQLKIITELLESENINKKAYTPKHMQKVINYSKCFSTKPKIPLENTFLLKYDEKMKHYNLLDFEDLLLKVKELFEQFPNILEKYQNIYQYILVDEFQDTNLVQYMIIKLLASKYRNIFVVGDDDQSIYSFRGTNYENMNLFKKEFSEKQIFHLTQNYRSTQSILSGSNKLIHHNKNREEKELFSNISGTKQDVSIYQAYNEKYEVEYVVEQIQRLKNLDYQYHEIAILYRSSVLSRNFELALLQVGIPYRIYGGISYLRRKEIKNVLAYLRLIVDHNDYYSFKRIINIPIRNLGETTVLKLEDFQKEEQISLFDAIDRSHETLTKSKSEALKEFKEMILEFSNMLEENSLLELFEALMKRIEYKEFLIHEEDNAEDRIENLEEFKSVLLGLEMEDNRLNNREKLNQLFDDATLADELGKAKTESPSGVLLSTIHSVKGLEFSCVFVVGMEEGIFPNTYRFESEDEIEEERRIAYVAVTRAKKKLFLTSTKSRMIYGRFTKNQVSRFLIEFSEGNQKQEECAFKKTDVETYKPTEQFRNANTKENNYHIGDKVLHSKYGEGVILSIEGDVGQIVFTAKGIITKIMLTHQTLSKKES